MKITVVAGKWAARYMAEDSIELVLPENSTVEDALKRLPLPADEIGITIIDGKSVARDFFLSDGDTLKIYPVIIGG